MSTPRPTPLPRQAAGLAPRIGALLAGLALAAVSACGAAPQGGTATVADPPADTSSAATSASPAPSSASPSTGASASATPAPKKKSPTPAAPSTTPAAKPILAPGDTGEQVRDLQVRLREISWLSGTITGTYDEATTKAVAAFQTKRKLDSTGSVDKATWKALIAMTSEPTKDQKHNILKPGKAILKQGDSSDKVKDLQARLKQVGWFSHEVTGNYGAVTVQAVKGFQAKRQIPETGEVDQRTWDKLAAMTRQPTQAELEDKPAAPEKGNSANLDPRCTTGRVMCVNKSTSQLSWVVDGKVLKVMDARFGCKGMATREGVFPVGWKSRNHTSTDYNTWMPFAMFFSGGQAVHYSPDFAANGYNGCSHGCVNIRDKAGVTWLYDQVRVGDKVVVHW